MPQLDLSELECKVMWLILDPHLPRWGDDALVEAELSLFDKVYRAYRGMPPERAA